MLATAIPSLSTRVAWDLIAMVTGAALGVIVGIKLIK
tara:strand:- start:470 stop:580 length:111 start_codon:yes stop_codon:yes gene_type:complete